MAGGLGTRLSPDKPLLEVCGRPMALRMAEVGGRLGPVTFAVVRGRPGEGLPGPKVYTSGRGYEWDVVEAVEAVGTPALVLPADVPLIRVDHLFALVEGCEADLCNLLSLGRFVGISLWRSSRPATHQDVELGERILNVNGPVELELARGECAKVAEGRS
ncbi:hypothetical protein HS1genome_1462 [Sulfodiicoccus acidiphilus]|uniref:MobA-like NTP transferase domain-containing protein n=2 Tax=Sulfodiicoccus acidiphilus TaxID=1670455 RepID=A0A348B4H1_9CREN|nr:NTP transferase domain-containing protein [Sulfodiicoccus acidiphilus]BBD73073.1 hypothetical protein HS1genome_1462 [Sulfodiicoccus acidiphilus]GGU04062.1 hypothetical protein GCM10007116_21080 [Sulfodiicoccus acidiphilus]